MPFKGDAAMSAIVRRSGCRPCWVWRLTGGMATGGRNGLWGWPRRSSPSPKAPECCGNGPKGPSWFTHQWAAGRQSNDRRRMAWPGRNADGVAWRPCVTQSVWLRFGAGAGSVPCWTMSSHMASSASLRGQAAVSPRTVGLESVYDNIIDRGALPAPADESGTRQSVRGHESRRHCGTSAAVVGRVGS
jgi:hypothetical protein